MSDEKEEAMTAPSRDEFNTAFEKIHTKLDANKDHFTEKIQGLGIKVAEIKKEMEMTPAVTLPDRPCGFFKAMRMITRSSVSSGPSRL